MAHTPYWNGASTRASRGEGTRRLALHPNLSSASSVEGLERGYGWGLWYEGAWYVYYEVVASRMLDMVPTNIR